MFSYVSSALWETYLQSVKLTGVGNPTNIVVTIKRVSGSKLEFSSISADVRVSFSCGVTLFNCPCSGMSIKWSAARCCSLSLGPPLNYCSTSRTNLPLNREGCLTLDDDIIIIFVYWRKFHVRPHQDTWAQLENKWLIIHYSSSNILKPEENSRDEIIIVFLR